MPAVAQRDQHAIVTLPEVPLVVQGDPARLQQVFSKLLNNAAKYSPASGHIYRRRGTRWRRRHGGGPRRWRRDRGGDAAARVRAVHAGIAQDRGGIGVGLAVVRSLVAAHGGAIEARSNGPDQGSEFIVRLPAVT
jgi:signal transduction histidine kinase